MQFATSILALAATLSWSSVLAAPLANPSSNTLDRRSEGHWEIHNHCSSPIYYTTVGEEGTLGSGQVNAGTTTSGSYGASGDGLSVKLCWTQGCSDPYQFETTVVPDNVDTAVSYDLSAINGNPFINVFNGVYTSDGSGTALWCQKGSESCAFTYPKSGPVASSHNIDTVVVAQFCN